MFSGGRERVHWERMGYSNDDDDDDDDDNDNDSNSHYNNNKSDTKRGGEAVFRSNSYKRGI